jgi:hypothetical protein
MVQRMLTLRQRMLTTVQRMPTPLQRMPSLRQRILTTIQRMPTLRRCLLTTIQRMLTLRQRMLATLQSLLAARQSLLCERGLRPGSARRPSQTVESLRSSVSGQPCGGERLPKTPAAHVPSRVGEQYGLDSSRLRPDRARPVRSTP